MAASQQLPQASGDQHFKCMSKRTHYTQSIPFHANILYYWVDYWGKYSTHVNPVLKHPPCSFSFTSTILNGGKYYFAIPTGSR